MASYKVGQKGFPSNNLLNINAMIEEKDSRDSSRRIFKDVIYLEFIKGKKNNNRHSGYDMANKIVVKFTSYELRVFIYALKSLILTGASEYKKYSDPNLASTNGNPKEITLGKQANFDKYFINIEEIENDKFGIGFNLFELKAFIDSLKIIADETDFTMYKYQRVVHQQINKSGSTNEN
ncbi:hypothetical protein [Aliarcobacter butzleri]|uniref:hypothetical protein n=1 Tax=Aliarcobacter butzleri TaxID=28197 RepID=UPI00126A603A|nr:hypothetical protein [Aliarcobacter butzleri]